VHLHATGLGCVISSRYVGTRCMLENARDLHTPWKLVQGKLAESHRICQGHSFWSV